MAAVGNFVLHDTYENEIHMYSAANIVLYSPNSEVCSGDMFVCPSICLSQIVDIVAYNVVSILTDREAERQTNTLKSKYNSSVEVNAMIIR